MVLSAVRGSIGFLTRLPVGADEAAWAAFARTPVAFPLAGYLVGALLAVPLLAVTVLPAGVLAAATLAWLYLLVGINNVDGLADLADAAVVHGSHGDRVAVLKDSQVGVGAVVAIGVVLLGTALGLFVVAGLPTRQALAIVVATEVGGKLVLAALACLGDAAFEGLGSAFTAESAPRDLVLPLLVALPVLGLSWPTPAAAGAVAGACLAGLLTGGYATRLLGGVNGDVFGAANELARVAGLHLGVVTWTLW